MIFLIISFIASTIGAICGIGGGVIIKPVLDLFHAGSVSTISFLSGCTVLSMSCYSVGKNILGKERKVNTATGLPLAVGSVIGGIAGKQIFVIIRSMSAEQNRVGLIQAICLGIVTLGTLAYIIYRDKIHTYKTENLFICILIGLVLGIISSFLGIGGGPINLVVLFFFFSMDTKTAAANSLYIILFSQAASLLTSFFTHTIPEFKLVSLILMIVGGIGGGIAGRRLNRKMDSRAVDKLLILVMAIIICICVYNGMNYCMGRGG